MNSARNQARRFKAKKFLGRRVIILAPMGTGGIASFARNLETHWAHSELGLKVWRVPRSNALGWLLYFPRLVQFIVNVLFFPTEMLHVNLASKGSPIRKFPYVLVAVFRGIKVVSQIHSGQFDKDLLSTRSGSVWFKVTMYILNKSECLIFINHDQMANLVANKIVSESRSKFLANHIHIPEELNLIADQKSFDGTFVGRVSEAKGANDLLEAIRLLPAGDAKFAIVGKVEIKNYLAPSVVSVNGHEVHFFGEVNNYQALDIIERSRFLILPSHSENFPMVILEALARGVPVIASRVGEIGRIISQDKSGKLVDSGDVHNLSFEIEDYLLNPAKAKEHGVAGRDFVNRNFNIKDYAERLTILYCESAEL